MTEDCKPETPIMTEISANDEALSALWSEWQRACEANDKAGEDEEKASLAKEAIKDHDTPEYRAATAEFEAAQNRPDETFAALIACEDRIENTPARSVEGAAIKLRVAKYWIDINHQDGLSETGRMAQKERLALSALVDLERMAETMPIDHTRAPAGTDDEFLALSRRAQTLNDTFNDLENKGAPEEEKRPVVKEIAALEDRLAQMPVTTVQGLAVKLSFLAEQNPPGGKWDFIQATTQSAFECVKHLIGEGTTTVATPATEDPVLALKREWDVRLERYKNEQDCSDEEIIDPLHDRLIETEFTIYRTPATTPEGIAIKLRMWGRNHPDPDRGENWCEPPVKDIEGNLDDMPILSVLCDLDRMARGVMPTMVTETGTNRFAVLLDEWNRAGSLCCDATKAKEAARSSERESLEKKEDAAGAREGEVWKAFLEEPCQTFADVLWKLRPLQGTLKGCTGGDVDDLLTAINDDLERLSKEPVVDEPLLALERRWREALKTFAEATPESPRKPSPDDMTTAISDAQEEMAVTPAQTIAGVLVKLRLYADLNSKPSCPTIDRQPLDNLELDQTAVVSAMRDLERLAGESTPPPAVTIGGTAMTETALSNALNGLSDVLAMVDSARHALGTILEDMYGQRGEHIGFCILRTLDAAAEQGQASYEIVNTAARKHETALPGKAA